MKYSLKRSEKALKSHKAISKVIYEAIDKANDNSYDNSSDKFVDRNPFMVVYLFINISIKV